MPFLGLQNAGISHSSFSIQAIISTDIPTVVFFMYHWVIFVRFEEFYGGLLMLNFMYAEQAHPASGIYLQIQ